MCSSNEDKNNSEHSSYVVEGSVVQNAEAQLNEEPFFERSGIVDVDSTHVTDEEMIRGACVNLKKNLQDKNMVEITRSEVMVPNTGLWDFRVCFPMELEGFIQDLECH